MSDTTSKFKQAEKILKKKRFDYISSNLQGNMVLIFWKDDYMYFHKHVVYTISFDVKHVVLGYLMEDRKCKCGYDICEATYAESIEQALCELRNLGNFVKRVHDCINENDSENSGVIFDDIHKQRMIKKCGEKSKIYC